MTPQEIILTHQVSATPQDVWDVLTEIDNAAEVLSGVQSIERLNGDTYEVGTSWRETRKMMGKSASQEMKVTLVDAPHRTVVEADSPGAHYKTEFIVESTVEGTFLTMAFTGTSTKSSFSHRLGLAFFGKLGMRATRNMMLRDVEDIVNAATRRSSKRKMV